jgi:hypothetical protein
VNTGHTWFRVNPNGNAGVSLRTWSANAVIDGRMVSCGGGQSGYSSLRADCASMAGTLATDIQFGSGVTLLPPLQIGVVFRYALVLTSAENVQLTLIQPSGSGTARIIDGAYASASRTVVSGVGETFSVHEGEVIELDTNDGRYTFVMYARMRSRLPAPPSTGDACRTVPTGRSCRMACPPAYYIMGGSQTATVNSAGFDGTQACVPAGAWQSNGAVATSLIVNGPAMTYCAATRTLYYGGGYSAALSSTAQMYQSTDGVTWTPSVIMPVARHGPMMVCDALGTVHVISGVGADGTSSYTAIRLAQGATVWMAGIDIRTSAPAFPGVSPLGHAVTIPSSGHMDYLFCHTDQPACYRYIASSTSFIVTTSAAPWTLRKSARLAYLGDKLFITGGSTGILNEVPYNGHTNDTERRSTAMRRKDASSHVPPQLTW